MVLFAAATTIPDSLFQQYDGSALYSPLIVSSLAGANVASSGVLNTALIPRSKRQQGAKDVEKSTTLFIKPQTSTEIQAFPSYSLF